MDSAEHISDDRLLDYCLEQCDEAAQGRIADALTTDAALAARCDRLRAVLAPLDTWTTPPPPTTMVSDILDRIAAHQVSVTASPAGPPVVRAAIRDESGGGRAWIISLREVLALAACLAIFAGLFGPSIKVVRHSAQRQMCASNLGQLGTGLASYASAYGGYQPYAGPAQGPFIDQPGRQRAPNTRHLYPLLKGGFIAGPGVLICAGRRSDVPMNEADVDRHSDFPDPRNRSFHLQYQVRPVRIRVLANPFVMPYASDANPVFEGDAFHEQVDPVSANSTSHGGRGQNVLHLDGHTGWYSRPILGTDGDSIWQIGTLRRYTGTEAPPATDAFMAP